MIYFAEPAIVDIAITKGDVTPLKITVLEDGVAYDMTGMQIDIDIATKSGTVIRSLSSAGASPAITIATSELTILPTAFTTMGTYRYDLQITDGTTIYTVMKGNWVVQNDITT